jgi:Protein of unknown function (DUF1566)
MEINDTSALALMVGQKMADGSIFAGLTADGKQQIYTMPADLDVTMKFNDAAKVVKELNDRNTLGHNDWQIPSLTNVLRVLSKNQNEGALKGTFNTSGDQGRGQWGSDYPGWYWSSTEVRDEPRFMLGLRLSDNIGDWQRTESRRLSVRPVRLLPVGAL